MRIDGERRERERESCFLLIPDEKNELADLVRGGIVLEVSFVKGISCMLKKLLTSGYMDVFVFSYLR